MRQSDREKRTQPHNERSGWRFTEPSSSSPPILTDLIEVEREVAGDGAIEARLEVGCPLVAELLGSALVMSAHSGNTGVHGLWV